MKNLVPPTNEFFNNLLSNGGNFVLIQTFIPLKPDWYNIQNLNIVGDIIEKTGYWKYFIDAEYTGGLGNSNIVSFTCICKDNKNPDSVYEFIRSLEKDIVYKISTGGFSAAPSKDSLPQFYAFFVEKKSITTFVFDRLDLMLRPTHVLSKDFDITELVKVISENWLLKNDPDTKDFAFTNIFTNYGISWSRFMYDKSKVYTMLGQEEEKIN